MVLSTIQRFRYRRNFLPSCVGGFFLFLRWGQMSSMPRLPSASRNRSLSYALSAMSRFGLVFGLPGPPLGTDIVANVSGASLTSAGEAEAMEIPRGKPLPSTTTMHFEPLPRLVLPTLEPLF